MTNVLPIRDDLYEIEHSLQRTEIAKILSSERFMFVTYLEDGSVKYFSGDNLNLGDICYLQKVFNIRTNSLIQDNMFGENDE